MKLKQAMKRRTFLTVGLIALVGCLQTACRSAGGSQRLRLDGAMGAKQVEVQLQTSGEGLESFREDLEGAMRGHYLKPGKTAFTRIQFFIDRVGPDSVSTQDLLLNGRLILHHPHGSATRKIERLIRGGASTSPREWSDETVSMLLSAFDHQLNLLMVHGIPVVD